MITKDSIKQFFILMVYLPVTQLTAPRIFQCYHFGMKCAGFVLAGGKSSRMGSDKALLPYRGRTLVEHVASEVREAAGSITLVGDPARYSYLGYPVIADIFPGCGPLSGIHAALAASPADWNLIVACDLPEVTAEFLSRLLERAESGTAQAVLPAGPSGMPEPLCAAYHRHAVEAVAAALRSGTRKVLDGLAGLEIDLWRVPDTGCFHNLNTPQDWACYCHG
jgi:molybdopterin-guanine dinucleotide biosynthesis protein A